MNDLAVAGNIVIRNYAGFMRCDVVMASSLDVIFEYVPTRLARFGGYYG